MAWQRMALQGETPHYKQRLSNISGWLYARRRTLLFFTLAGFLILVFLYQFTSVFRSTSLYSISYVEQAGRHKSRISQKIWQILLPMPLVIKTKPVGFADPGSWLQMNPGYTYTLFGAEGARSFIHSKFPDRPELLQTFKELRNPGLKSDFLRYLVLYAEGGVYSDLDTTPERAIDDWVPEDFEAEARLVVGIEYDYLGAAEIKRGYAHPVQFAQWTIAAAPNHGVFLNMTENCLQALQALSQKYNQTLGELHSKDDEVLRATGPAAWTETVFAEISAQVPGITSLKELSGMKQPKLFGNVLVLPIDGFGSGLPHSGSSRWFKPKEALASHHSKGSWRVGE